MESGEFVCGRVASGVREQYVIWTERGEVTATLSGRFRAGTSIRPCVGDWVRLHREKIIVEILPRRTRLSRKEPGSAAREQVLAANVDVLFIVSGLDHDYNPRRLERYLVVAAESGARAVVVLNKADLRADFEECARAAREQLGTRVLAVSARTGLGLGKIAAEVKPGETAALIGSSGAGKSTIVNTLLGEDRQATSEVRPGDARGRHTTTERQLFLLPGNWFLIDMPGLREVGPWAEAEQADDVFREIAVLARQCRFRDCRHEMEPGCAVRAAGLDAGRLAGYRKLKRELAFLERERGRRLAQAEKRRWKAAERASRRNPKAR
ncbi:MAG TPA: ribosome small subunit-dependent GTPase A [Bryobacteraceae bacterium]|jgi:ribosome biogenesis GTPase|nr:ribosome small subunit-dependent GTPase A [Bryobacteraceae bacterium]